MTEIDISTKTLKNILDVEEETSDALIVALAQEVIKLRARLEIDHSYIWDSSQKKITRVDHDLPLSADKITALQIEIFHLKDQIKLIELQQSIQRSTMATLYNLLHFEEPNISLAAGLTKTALSRMNAGGSGIVRLWPRRVAMDPDTEHLFSQCYSGMLALSTIADFSLAAETLAKSKIKHSGGIDIVDASDVPLLIRDDEKKITVGDVFQIAADWHYLFSSFYHIGVGVKGYKDDIIDLPVIAQCVDMHIRNWLSFFQEAEQSSLVIRSLRESGAYIEIDDDIIVSLYDFEIPMNTNREMQNYVGRFGEATGGKKDG